MKRDTRIDLFKCLLMLGVMIIHTIEHGYGFANKLQEGIYVWNSHSILEYLLMCISSVAVNCYFLISGYYGMKYSRKKFVKFVIMMLFYSAFTYVVGVVSSVEQVSLGTVIRGVILGWRSYWFMIVYLILYLFSKVVHATLDQLEQDAYTKFLCVYFGINTILGFVFHSNEYGSALSVLPMFMMFCVGRYIRRFQILMNRKSVFWLSIYLATTIISLIGSIALFSMGSQRWSYLLTIDYCSPLIVTGAIALFAFFINIKPIKREIWSKIAPYTLAVYLMTETVVARKWAYMFLDDFDKTLGLLSIIVYAIALYIFAIIVEFIRSRIESKVLRVLKRVD
ncbi:MAG: hypothetical protein E7299_04195 [Lachnospiraceae bacterium]|nr:hypothetical protein [Lachnospiraceae bacterium]